VTQNRAKAAPSEIEERERLSIAAGSRVGAGRSDMAMTLTLTEN